jgi:hypothetical protein
MSIQVLALRFESGTALGDIAEVIYRDDDDGKLGYMDRASFAEWVNDNPTIRVYLRDHIGDNRVVMSYSEGSSRFLRVDEAQGDRDPLLRLPRFITRTKPLSTEAVRAKSAPQTGLEPGDPMGALWWFWWWPKGK